MTNIPSPHGNYDFERILKMLHFTQLLNLICFIQPYKKAVIHLLICHKNDILVWLLCFNSLLGWSRGVSSRGKLLNLSYYDCKRLLLNRSIRLACQTLHHRL